MKPEIQDLIQTGFYSLLSLCALIGVQMLSGMKKSIEELNVKMAEVLKDQGHNQNRFDVIERDLDDHEGRIRSLEKHGGK